MKSIIIKEVNKKQVSIIGKIKEAIKEKARNKYKNLTEKENELKRKY